MNNGVLLCICYQPLPVSFSQIEHVPPKLDQYHDIKRSTQIEPKGKNNS